MTKSIDETLAERNTQHGNFRTHCLIEIKLQSVRFQHSSSRLTPVQSIALQMIFHKCARILNGGNQHSDTWKDIAGYARLAEKEILDE
jgi:hypothetical protein